MKLLILTLLLTGCATGVSTYEYTHNADGSTTVKIKSANEIEGGMKMGINRDTGTLEVELGTMSKRDNTVEALSIARDMVHDVTAVVTPGSGG